LNKALILLALSILFPLAVVDARGAEVVERPLEFPRDGGAHRGYGMEWWYTSGHLESTNGRSFGFMSAFFKVEKTPIPIHVCMLGLTDENTGRHYSISRVDETSAGVIEALVKGVLLAEPDHPLATKLLAYTDENRARVVFDKPVDLDSSRMSVLFDDCGIEQISREKMDFTQRLAWNGVELDLTLISKKKPMLVGGAGIVEMGTGGLSYYYSFTRLDTSGTLTLDGEKIPVTGLAWFDHQWGNWQSSKGYHGWDWFSVQLDNDMDLNLFSFRTEDGKQVNATATILDGEELIVSRDMRLSASDSWTNPITGNTYPINWNIEIPDRDIVLNIVPTIPNQEMCLAETIGLIWEGSTNLTGSVRGKPVTGTGYTELTGYATIDGRHSRKTRTGNKSRARGPEFGTPSVPQSGKKWMAN
jgi:predicted secreted hydrolase